MVRGFFSDLSVRPSRYSIRSSLAIICDGVTASTPDLGDHVQERQFRFDSDRFGLVDRRQALSRESSPRSGRGRHSRRLPARSPRFEPMPM